MNEREVELRRLANENRGEVDEEFVEPIEPRAISQMLSLRIEGWLMSELREIANERASSLSDVVREALQQVVAARNARAHGQFVVERWTVNALPQVQYPIVANEVTADVGSRTGSSSISGTYAPVA